MGDQPDRHDRHDREGQPAPGRGAARRDRHRRHREHDDRDGDGRGAEQLCHSPSLRPMSWTSAGPLLADLGQGLVTALDDDRCVEDYRRDGGQAEPRQGRDGQPGRERGPDSGRHAAIARRALPARGEHGDRVAREHAQRDQVGRPGGGERQRVPRPAMPARQLRRAQQQQRGERGEARRERVGPGLLGVAGDARDEGEEQSADQSRAGLAEPPPGQRDRRRGHGHRDGRGQAQRRRGVAEDRQPQVQPEVVNAEYRVDVVHHHPQLRHRPAGRRPGSEFVAPQHRHVDLGAAERRGGRGGRGPGKPGHLRRRDTASGPAASSGIVGAVAGFIPRRPFRRGSCTVHQACL